MAYERAGYRVSDPSKVKTLIANSDDITTRKVLILMGQKLEAGAVIGKVPAGAVTITAGPAVSGSGGAAGNGVVNNLTADSGAPAGIYQLRVLNPATNAGSFEVIRPDGIVDGNGTVGVAYNGIINFTLADGSVDFVEDDRIPIALSYADDSGKYKLSLAASVDGSQVPDMILAEDIDATAGDVEAIAYETATVVKSGLVIGAGHTISTIRDPLRRRGIKIDD